MRPLVVTFDAANTLVRVHWTPGGFALDCTRAVGLDLGDEERGVYEKALRSRWPEYQEINRSRDPELGDAFWFRLTQEWLGSIGQPPGLAYKIKAVAPDLLYGKDSKTFELFDDVMPTLDALDALGVRLGVVSNWDYSLHRVLVALNVHHRFEHVVASLQEGVEKPDPELFELTLAKFGVAPSAAVHVGDDPSDDFQGAQGFGMRAYLIDRRQTESRGAILARLTDLTGALELD